MAHKAPGKSARVGISLVDIFRMFPDDATAEAWFVEGRWSTGIAGPHCGSLNVQTGAKHKTMPYWCRGQECAKRFSAKTGTVMEGSKLGLQTWMIAAYLPSTSLKSVSGLKLRRAPDINQRSAWFPAHRLRVALSEDGGICSGPVELDESYFGGKRKNISNAKRKKLVEQGASRGAIGRTAVVGIKDWAANHIRAKVTHSAVAPARQGFVVANTSPNASASTSRGWRAPTASSRCDRCSSALTWARSTSSRRSTRIAACRHSPDGTTSAKRIPST